MRREKLLKLSSHASCSSARSSTRSKSFSTIRNLRPTYNEHHDFNWLSEQFYAWVWEFIVLFRQQRVKSRIYGESQKRKRLLSDSMAHVVSALSCDREVAGFTPVLGAYAVVPLGKVLYANSPGSVVIGELFWLLASQTRTIKRTKLMQGSPESSPGQCMWSYVSRQTLCYESGG